MPEVEADRAVILTRVYKETEGEPIITRRAKAFKAICEELPITIRPNELIVGSNAKSPRSCQVFPEYSFDWVTLTVKKYGYCGGEGGSGFVNTTYISNYGYRTGVRGGTDLKTRLGMVTFLNLELLPEEIQEALLESMTSTAD